MRKKNPLGMLIGLGVLGAAVGAAALDIYQKATAANPTGAATTTPATPATAAASTDTSTALPNGDMGVNS